MGCDIHIHQEIKVNGKWLHYNNPDARLPRFQNYLAFAWLADVRNETHIRPIAQPRGLPADCSETTRFDSEHWGVDGHSHSWLSSSEVAQFEKWFERKAEGQGWKLKLGWFEDYFGYLFGNSWNGWFEYPKDNLRLREQGLEDWRWVFWFDN